MPRMLRRSTGRFWRRCHDMGTVRHRRHRPDLDRARALHPVQLGPLQMSAWLSLARLLAPWAIAVLAIGYGLLERAHYQAEVAARAGDRLAAAEAANRQHQQDAELSARLMQ